MTTRSLTLDLLPGALAICRLAPGDAVPAWVDASAPGGSASNLPLLVITRTTDELSIVCAAARVPPGVVRADGWRALRVAGPLDFALTGILAALAVPLAAAEISIFAISTYDTDYVLVRAEQLAGAVATLEAAGHVVRAADPA
jgi:hypothetical protein